MSRRTRAASWLTLCACLLASLVGCESTASAARAKLSVFAASSLTEAFAALVPAFEASHPHVQVQVSTAGSQVLRLQIEQGARADVFASANAAHMQALVEEGEIAQAQVLAHNALVVIVPEDNPAGLSQFRDLPRARRVVIGSANVPVGAYTRSLLQAANAEYGVQFAERVLSRVVSTESNVRLVRAKVELGEADAAIVYRTDASSGHGVRALPIPPAISPPVRYLIGRVVRRQDAAQAALADEFVAFARSAAGQRILAAHGFITQP